MKKETMVDEIAQCLINNNPDGIVEILSVAVAAKRAKDKDSLKQIPRTTLRNIFAHKNRTIQNLCKVIACL